MCFTRRPAAMNNLHLFELINASPGLSPLRLALATALAEWVIYLLPLGAAVAWLAGDRATRSELLHMLLVLLLALLAAQFVAHAWPQPRPSALHVGTQYVAHADDPGLPSEHVTVFWSLALAALATRRFAVWAFPLLAAGLLVGVSRVYLGIHFPYDVLAAAPDALLAAGIGLALRKPLSPVVLRVLVLYDRATSLVAARLR
jgi:undecaprenyl-diphosphatase